MHIPQSNIMHTITSLHLKSVVLVHDTMSNCPFCHRTLENSVSTHMYIILCLAEHKHMYDPFIDVGKSIFRFCDTFVYQYLDSSFHNILRFLNIFGQKGQLKWDLMI